MTLAPAEHPPAAVLAEVYHLQYALADLLRALLTQDENYVVGDLAKLAWHRNKLIEATSDWWPELRRP